jgi:hypothetical protein
MWILTWLPDWITHAIFFAGAAGIFLGFVLTFVPFVKQYKMAIQIASLFVFALGVYLEGAMADNNEWLAKVKELEARVAVAEERSKTENVKVEEKIVTKTQVVTQKGKDIIQYIDREVVKNNDVIKYIENCPVPKEVIDAHNVAAKMNQAAQGDKK